MTETPIHMAIDLAENYVKEPPKPRGPQPDVEEFMRNPNQYSVDRGIRDLRHLVIVPVRTQVRLVDGTFGEKFVDILRKVRATRGSKQYNDGSGKLGFKDRQRYERATGLPA